MQNEIKRRRFIKVIALIALGIIAVVPTVFKKFLPRFGSPVNSGVKSRGKKTQDFYIVTVDNKGKITNNRHGQAEYFAVLDLPDEGSLKMVSIPTGLFLMGSPHDEPKRNSDEGLSDGKQHNVIVKPFYMGKYPVTQAQWEEVAKLPKVKLTLYHTPSTFGDNTPSDANLPVETVSWEEANEFCDRLTREFGGKYRLPSEAEWEYACRAKTKTPFYFGDTITPELANYDVINAYRYEPKGTKEKYRGKTIQVNKIQYPNSFGLESIHGNVWEWCADSYHRNYDKTPPDGSPWQDNEDNKFRVIRGGAWHSFPSGCRSASRNYKPQKMKSNTIGFRVVYVDS